MNKNNSKYKPDDKPIINQLWMYHEELVKNKGLKFKKFVIELYEYMSEILIVHGYSETSIKNYFGSYIFQRLNIKWDVKKPKYPNYTNITKELFDNCIKDDYELLVQDNKFNDLIYTVGESFKEEINSGNDTKNKEELKELLKSIDKTDKSIPEPELIKRLTRLLEIEHGLFTIDVPDKRTKSGFKRKYFQIDKKSNTYKEVSRSWLQQLFINEYDVQLHELPDFYDNTLNRIGNIKKINNNYLELENVFINKLNYEIVDKEELNIFTNDRLFYETFNESGDIRLFKYDKDISIFDILSTDGKAAAVEPTLATDTFMKIFVPKTEPNNIKLLRYMLQTIGMMVLGKNPAKRITILYDETDEEKNKDSGDTGKSTALEIIKMIFSRSTGDLTDKTLKDQFIINTVEQGSHFLKMDELKGNELKDFIHIIKRLSSGYSFDGRKTYDDKQTSVNVPPIVIAMNGIPILPLYDKAYLGRFVLIKVPNKFLPDEEIHPNENEYPAVSNIEDRIKQDGSGLSQLLSLCINEFLLLEQDKSIKNQLALNPTIEETIMITTKDDPVTGILKAYTKAYARTTSKQTWVSIPDLQQTIKQVYKKAHHIEINPELIDNKTIGYKLKELYPELLNESSNKARRTGDGKTVYNITLFTMDEVNKKENEIIVTIPLKEHEKIFDTLQLQIYQKIKNGVHTESKLIEEFSETNNSSDIMDALEELYQYGRIEFTNNLNFME